MVDPVTTSYCTADALPSLSPLNRYIYTDVVIVQQTQTILSWQRWTVVVDVR